MTPALDKSVGTSLPGMMTLVYVGNHKLFIVDEDIRSPLILLIKTAEVKPLSLEDLSTAGAIHQWEGRAAEALT